MAERRRLPVIQNAPAKKEAPGDGDEGGAGENEEKRPPWHWVGFGTVAIFATWVVLSYAAAAVSSRVMAERFGKDASADQVRLAMEAMDAADRARLMATIALPNVLALALAAFAGGIVVGRFGHDTGAREAARAGAVVALIASVLGWAGMTLASFVAAAVTFLVAVGFAAWGGRLGASRRPKA